jgi:hypothetical protein
MSGSIVIEDVGEPHAIGQFERLRGAAEDVLEDPKEQDLDAHRAIVADAFSRPAVSAAGEQGVNPNRPNVA